MNLTIKPIPKKYEHRSKINPRLPQNNIVFVAPSNSGKSTIIINLILRKKFGYLEEYQKIYIFTPTLYLDSSWDLVLEYTQKKHPKKYADIVLFDEYDEDQIENIFSNQEETEKSQRKRVLIILDDIADQLKSNNPLLKKVFFKGRHYGISCWISSQSYKSIPRSVRINSPGFIFLNINPNERNMIVQELSRENKDVFLRKLDNCLTEKYSFIYLNMRSPLDKMYCKNFNEFIQ